MLPWFLRILAKRQSIQLSGFGYLALAYLGWIALSSILKAPYLYLSAAEFVQEVKYFLLFVYVANAVDSRELVKGLIGVLMFCLFVEGVVAFVGFRSQEISNVLSFLSSPTVEQSTETPMGAIVYEENESGRRATGTFANYTVTALYLHFLLPLVFSKFLMNLGNKKQWLYLSLFSLGIGTLWVTYSRTGLIAAAFGLVVCFYLCHRRGFITSRLLFIMAYATMLTLLIISPTLKNYLTSRPSTLPDRLPIVEKSLNLIVGNPVLGVGLNNSTAVKKETFVDTALEEGTQPIHNHYLVVATESGLVGLILFAGFFALIGKEAFRQMKSLNVEIASFAIAILSTYATFSVHMLADTMFSYVPYAMLWFYAGLVVAFKRMEQRDSRSTEL
jgi:O-antigen ligase